MYPAIHKKILKVQNQALELLARGNPLTHIFDTLTLGAEQNVKGAMASILLLDNTGNRLIDGSSPNFTREMKDTFNGMLIGPLEGSCGTAAYSRELVVVEDINCDPRWAKYKDFAVSQGLQSCYSSPIIGSDGNVLGTFALTFREAKAPSNIELEILNSSTHIASLAIERKRYEKNLQIYAKDLEEFSAIAAHDLQEPLRKIISFGDLLELKIPVSDQQSRHYVERMRSAATRMRNLVNDLLQFTRMGSRKKIFEPTDLKKVAENILEDLDDRIRESKGKVIINDLPVVDADPVQMHQLFLNLIGNALKFHRENVPPVVTLGHTCNSMGQWEITVEDNGIGIDEEHINKIFQPFERLHGKTTYEGTGIGLTICNKIVSRHGGQIGVKKKSSDGVIFHFTLPKFQQTRHI